MQKNLTPNHRLQFLYILYGSATISSGQKMSSVLKTNAVIYFLAVMKVCLL